MLHQAGVCLHITPASHAGWLPGLQGGKAVQIPTWGNSCLLPAPASLALLAQKTTSASPPSPWLSLTSLPPSDEVVANKPFGESVTTNLISRKRGF